MAQGPSPDRAERHPVQGKAGADGRGHVVVDAHGLEVAHRLRRRQHRVGADRLDRAHVGLTERADACPAQVVEVRAAPERPPEVVRQDAHVGARGALDERPVHARARRVGRRVEAVDRDRPRLALHLDALAGQLVEPASPHLHRGDHGGHLLDLPRQRGGGRLHVRWAHAVHVERRRHLARRIERRGRGPEDDVGRVRLGQHGQEAHQARGAAEPDQQDPGGIGVEGAGMADPALPEDAAAARHHVVRGPAGRLVDDHQAVDAHVVGGSSSCTSWCNPRSSSSTRVPAAIARVGLEAQPRRPLHRHLRPDEPLQVGPLLLQHFGRRVVQRREIHHRRPHVGRHLDRGHGQHRQLVRVRQPLELLRHHLPQHLVDPQRPRIGRRTPSHAHRVSSSARTRAQPTPTPTPNLARRHGPDKGAAQVRAISRSS